MISLFANQLSSVFLYFWTFLKSRHLSDRQLEIRTMGVKFFKNNFTEAKKYFTRNTETCLFFINIKITTSNGI